MPLPTSISLRRYRFSSSSRALSSRSSASVCSRLTHWFRRAKALANTSPSRRSRGTTSAGHTRSCRKEAIERAPRGRPDTLSGIDRWDRNRKLAASSFSRSFPPQESFASLEKASVSPLSSIPLYQGASALSKIPVSLGYPSLAHEWVTMNSFPSSENSARPERSTSRASTICRRPCSICWSTSEGGRLTKREERSARRRSNRTASSGGGSAWEREVLIESRERLRARTGEDRGHDVC